MTIMRKIGFIAVSISAFIYLVLQTSQGQLWLSKTQQSLLGEATKETGLVASNAPIQDGPIKDAPIDSFTQFLNNSKHATQISELEIQLKHMQTDIVEMAAAMQQLTALKSTEPAVHDKQQIAPVVQPLASSQSRKADARLRQLEHQARLQEVVQRMELTALQAISR
jgi:hypothetical protein